MAQSAIDSVFAVLDAFLEEDGPGNPRLNLIVAPVHGRATLVAVLGVMGIFPAGPWQRLPPRRLPAYLMLALLAITAPGLLISGGTSSSSSVLSSVSATPPASNTGTPLGPSIVTLTATSGNASKATTININVN